MAFEISKTRYSGQIKEITLGKGDGAVTVGGESCYPFYLFEGGMPRLPRIALEVYDCPPEEWAPPKPVEGTAYGFDVLRDVSLKPQHDDLVLDNFPSQGRQPLRQRCLYTSFLEPLVLGNVGDLEALHWVP